MRVSVTDIDQLNYLRNSDYIEKSPDEIVSDMRDREETEAMRRGTGFHDLLEGSECGELTEVVRPPSYVFDFTKLDATVDLPPVRELKGELHLKLDGIEMTVAGKVDCIHGFTVDDHKLTKRITPETYEDSVQWRFYLHMFGGQTFRYNLFEYKEDKQDPSRLYITNFQRLVFYRYPELGDDVRQAAYEFINFCRCFWPERLEDTLGIKQLI